MRQCAPIAPVRVCTWTVIMFAIWMTGSCSGSGKCPFRPAHSMSNERIRNGASFDQFPAAQRRCGGATKHGGAVNSIRLRTFGLVRDERGVMRVHLDLRVRQLRVRLGPPVRPRRQLDPVAADNLPSERNSLLVARSPPADTPHNRHRKAEPNAQQRRRNGTRL